MAGHPLWPDDVEDAARRILADFEQKLRDLEPAAKEVPQLIADLRALTNDGRNMLAALNAKIAEADDVLTRVRDAVARKS